MLYLLKSFVYLYLHKFLSFQVERERECLVKVLILSDADLKSREHSAASSAVPSSSIFPLLVLFSCLQHLSSTTAPLVNSFSSASFFNLQLPPQPRPPTTPSLLHHPLHLLHLRRLYSPHFRYTIQSMNHVVMYCTRRTSLYI